MRPATGGGEAALVARCRAGDEQAWRALVEQYSRLVHGLLRGAFRLASHDAEDAFQEVFTRVYLRLDSVRDGDALRGWIAQITRNVALDSLRRAGRESGEQVLEEAFAEPLQAVEEALSVRVALQHLAPHQREILDRFFAQDESYRTIASELGLPAGTIASRISRALAALRIELESPGR